MFRSLASFVIAIGVFATLLVASPANYIIGTFVALSAFVLAFMLKPSPVGPDVIDLSPEQEAYIIRLRADVYFFQLLGFGAIIAVVVRFGLTILFPA